MEKKTQASVKSRKKRVGRILLAVSCIAVLAAVVYVMANGLGLIDSLDFGAGAYYYADIPAFQRYVNGDAYTSETPAWAIVLLFLVWGALMYRLWVWIDKKDSRKK